MILGSLWFGAEPLGLARVSHRGRPSWRKAAAALAHCAGLSPLSHYPSLAHTAKRISSNNSNSSNSSNSSSNNNNYNNNSTRIAITIAITLALLATQQVHGWAQSCADGTTGAYCLLEQIWSLSNAMDVDAVASDVCWAKTSMLQGDPFRQRQWDLAIPLMCVTDC